MPKPLHRKHARTIVAGAITVAIAGVLAWVAITVQGGGELPGRSYTYVTAAFRNVGTLKPREDVTQNGQRIGQVTSVSYRDGLAYVALRLEGDHPVYRDASAAIGNQSVLGRKHIELTPGTPAAGQLGEQALPASHTKDSTAIDDVLATFSPQAREGLSTTLREVGGGLTGRSGDLHDFVRTSPGSLDDVGRITGAVSDPRSDLPGLLRTADRLSGAFEGRQHELTDLLGNMNSTLGAVSVDQGRPLADTVRELPSTLRAARSGLDALGPPLGDAKAALATLRPGAQALGATANDARGVLREAPRPLGKLPDIADQAVPAVDQLTGATADLRPLMPRVSRAIGSADGLLGGLAPYATDIARFFGSHDLLSGQFSPDQHYFSAMLPFPGAFNASVPDPLATRIPYPQPGGGAWRDNPAQGGNRR